MKRHLVMDLYHGDQTEEVGDWEDVSNLPKSTSCKVKVKLDDDTETFAYFYQDACSWAWKYGVEPCKFWDCKTKEPISNVKQWRMMK